MDKPSELLFLRPDAIYALEDGDVKRVLRVSILL